MPWARTTRDVLRGSALGAARERRVRQRPSTQVADAVSRRVRKTLLARGTTLAEDSRTRTHGTCCSDDRRFAV
jgi:hypothetical protein